MKNWKSPFIQNDKRTVKLATLYESIDKLRRFTNKKKVTDEIDHLKRHAAWADVYKPRVQNLYPPIYESRDHFIKCCLNLEQVWWCGAENGVEFAHPVQS